MSKYGLTGTLAYGKLVPVTGMLDTSYIIPPVDASTLNSSGNVTEGTTGYMKDKANFTSGLNLLDSFTYDGNRGSFYAKRVISPASNGITILQSGVYRVMIVATVRNSINAKR